MPWKQRGQQCYEQSGAHARAGMDDFDSDVTRVFKLTQVALHGAPVLVESAHQPGDGDVGGAGVAIFTVNILHQLARAAAGAVGQVGIVLDPRGHLRHIGAAVARRRVQGFQFGGKVTGSQ